MSIMILHEQVDPDDPQGRTFKEINLQKKHNIPIGSLVEGSDGCRSWVVHHGRDCDGTPIYYLCLDRANTERERYGFINHGWSGGYSENSLIIINDHLILKGIDMGGKLQTEAIIMTPREQIEKIIKDAIDKAARIKIPTQSYLWGLEDARKHLDSAIIDARDDYTLCLLAAQRVFKTRGNS